MTVVSLGRAQVAALRQVYSSSVERSRDAVIRAVEPGRGGAPAAWPDVDDRPIASRSDRRAGRAEGCSSFAAMRFSRPWRCGLVALGLRVRPLPPARRERRGTARAGGRGAAPSSAAAVAVDQRMVPARARPRRGCRASDHPSSTPSIPAAVQRAPYVASVPPVVAPDLLDRSGSSSIAAESSACAEGFIAAIFEVARRGDIVLRRLVLRHDVHHLLDGGRRSPQRPAWPPP